MTCENAGLTGSGAVCTFRIAPSGWKAGRRDRTRHRSRPGGGDTDRMETVRPGNRQGREAARSLSWVRIPGAEEGRETRSGNPATDREIVSSGVRRPRARAGREAGTRTTDRRTVARPAGGPQGRRRCGTASRDAGSTGRSDPLRRERNVARGTRARGATEVEASAEITGG